VGLSARLRRIRNLNERMQGAKTIGVIFLAAIGILFLILLVLFQYAPAFARLDPYYREAKKACDSLKIGDTYDAVKAKVGNFFPADAELDKDGNGQVWLINNVKSVQVACDVEFRNGRVTFAEMMNEGAFWTSATPCS